MFRIARVQLPEVDTITAEEAFNILLGSEYLITDNQSYPLEPLNIHMGTEVVVETVE
jgi:hypothetical protein